MVEIMQMMHKSGTDTGWVINENISNIHKISMSQRWSEVILINDKFI